MKGGATIAQIPNKKDSTKNTNATTPSSDQHEYDLYSILTSGDRHQQGAKDSVPYPMPQSHTSTPSTVLQQNPIPYYENRQMYPQQNDYLNYYQQQFQHENLLNGNQYYGYNPQQTPNGHYQTQVPFRAHADGQLMNLSLPAVAPLNYRKTTLKLVMLGNSGVGKTSLMNRYHSNKYTGQYKATIGADFLSKTIQMDDCSVTLTIWDTAGQERFQSLGKAFYRGSDACVLVYDVQDFQSLEGLRKWKEDFEDCLISSEGTSMGKSGRSFNQQISPKVQFVVVGNKADKEEECKVVTIEDGKRFADEIGGMFFECSAKTGMNVNELFMVAARAGLEYNRNKNMGIGISRHTYGQQNTDGRPPASMRGYIPPRRTVDLNRTSSSRMGNDDCC